MGYSALVSIDNNKTRTKLRSLRFIYHVLASMRQGRYVPQNSSCIVTQLIKRF